SSAGPVELHLREVIAEDGHDSLPRLLQLWKGSRVMLPAALNLKNGHSKLGRFRCEGGVTMPRRLETPATLLVRCVPQFHAAGHFRVLVEQIEHLSREIRSHKSAQVSLARQAEQLTRQ